MAHEADAVDRKGPVFVSYRQWDGTDTATPLGWLLRSAGVPVWQDVSDLAPGNTESRLEEALGTGLSGAVLVATPDLAASGIVRKVELPRLLALAEDPNFVLAIANTVQNADGKIDYAAPDRLLGQARGTLDTIKQYPAVDRAGLLALVKDMLMFRVGRFAAAHRGSTTPPLHLSVQTRDVAADAEADLNIRIRPPQAGRMPDADGVRDFQAVLPLVPPAITKAGARHMRITGGAHLSLAFALGMSVPGTLFGKADVEDTYGNVWTCGPVSRTPADPAATKVGPRSHAPVKPTGTARNVLAYVDLMPGDGAAYARLLDEHHEQFDAWERIQPAAAGRLDPTTADALIEEVAGRLRALVAENEHAHLHLLLHVPFPVALLLGRLCNTLTVTVYEWDDERQPDDSDVRPRYVPVLTVSASELISDVLLPTTDPKGNS